MQKFTNLTDAVEFIMAKQKEIASQGKPVPPAPEIKTLEQANAYATALEQALQAPAVVPSPSPVAAMSQAQADDEFARFYMGIQDPTMKAKFFIAHEARLMAIARRQ